MIDAFRRSSSPSVIGIIDRACLESSAKVLLRTRSAMGACSGGRSIVHPRSVSTWTSFCSLKTSLSRLARRNLGIRAQIDR